MINLHLFNFQSQLFLNLHKILSAAVKFRVIVEGQVLSFCIFLPRVTMGEISATYPKQNQIKATQNGKWNFISWEIINIVKNGVIWNVNCFDKSFLCYFLIELVTMVARQTVLRVATTKSFSSGKIFARFYFLPLKTTLLWVIFRLNVKLRMEDLPRELRELLFIESWRYELPQDKLFTKPLSKRLPSIPPWRAFPSATEKFLQILVSRVFKKKIKCQKLCQNWNLGLPHHGESSWFVPL